MYSCLYLNIYIIMFQDPKYVVSKRQLERGHCAAHAALHAALHWHVYESAAHAY